MEKPPKFYDRRTARAFAVLFLLIMIIGVIATSGVNRLSKQFRSMYEDRLEPAIEIAEILELLYENRLHLEEHITGVSVETEQELERDISHNNRRIDTLVEKYTQTYHVREEISELRRYRQNIRAYRQVADQVLTLSRTGDQVGAQRIFTQESYPAFQNAIEPVERLAGTQATVGAELYEEATETANNIRISLYIAMAAAIIITIVVAVSISVSAIEQ